LYIYVHITKIMFFYLRMWSLVIIDLEEKEMMNLGGLEDEVCVVLFMEFGGESE